MMAIRGKELGMSADKENGPSDQSQITDEELEQVAGGLEAIVRDPTAIRQEMGVTSSDSLRCLTETVNSPPTGEIPKPFRID